MSRLLVTAFFAPLLWLSACSTQPIKPYTSVSSASERSAEQSGLKVGLDPFVSSALTKEYFDIDAGADGIAILHVRVENRTTDQTFLVEKKNFQLVPDGSAGGMTADGKKIERSKEGATNVEMAGAVLGGLGGSGLYLAGLASVSESMEIQRNFTSKEMADATLAPGKSLEGFIYFAPVKKGDDWTRAAAIKISMTETRTQQLVTMTVPLSR